MNGGTRTPPTDRDVEALAALRDEMRAVIDHFTERPVIEGNATEEDAPVDHAVRPAELPTAEGWPAVNGGTPTPLRPPALECTCGNSALCIACLLDEFTEEARAFWAPPPHGARRLRLVTESDFAAMSYGPNDNHSRKAGR